MRAAAGQSPEVRGASRTRSICALSCVRLLLVGLADLRSIGSLGLSVALDKLPVDGAAFGAPPAGRLLLLGVDDRETHLALLLALGRVDHDGRAGGQLLAQDEVGERVLDVALDRPTQWAGAHGGVPALFDQQVLGGLGQLELQLALGHRLADAQEQQLDDLLDLLLLQLVEDDHVVDAVEELGAEHFLELAHDPALHVVVCDPGLVVGDGEAERRVARDLGGADVRGHDHDRVAEVHSAALGVREPAVLEDLQEDVEDVGVGLLDLVEQQHRVGLAPDRLGQLAALVVADVAGGRADEPRDGVLLHVLGHVDPDQRLVVAEEELGERARELGLAHARGAQEDERAGRTLGVLEAGAGAPDRLGDDLDGGVLADHALVQFVLHAHQLLGLGLGQLEDGDAGPHRDDVGDLLLADRGTLAGLARFPCLLELAFLIRELALLVAQGSRLLELLGLDRRLLLAAGGLDFGLQLAVGRRGGHRLDAHPRGGLVDQVDRLVGQEAVGDVAAGQFAGGAQRLVGDLDLVVLLVAVAQAAQDLDGLVDRGLIDGDLLEAALQGGVALEVLAVLVERRGSDRLQLAAGERRLEDGGGVDGALGGAGADEVVKLVDEQDDVAALGDLLHHLLQALLELAAVLRAGHERGQVERVDLLVLEQLGHLGARDALGQALDHGGLAHARLAHQHRVVLGAPREDLHDPLDLGLASHARVELALGRELGEVAPELVEQLRGLLALAGGRARAGARASGLSLAATAGTGEHADDLVADLLGVGVEVEQDAGGHALVLAHQAEQDVLGADVVVAEAQSLAQGELEHLLGPGRERNLTGGDLLTGADDPHDLRAHPLDGDVQALQHAGRQTLLLAEQPEEDVLGADVVVLERSRLLLREYDHLPGPFGESLEHCVIPSYLGRCLKSFVVRMTPLESVYQSTPLLYRGHRQRGGGP